MWVNTESFYDGRPSKMNLGVAMNVADLGDHFRVYFAGESGFQAVRKTPEMIEAYNSLVPEKSRLGMPSEPEWVAQTAVPARVGIDQFRYVRSDGTPEKDWAPVQEEDVWVDEHVYGFVALDGTTLELRCMKEVQP